MKKILLFILFPTFIYAQTQIGQDIDGEAAFDRSGRSISTSEDGNVVAIGAFGNSGNGDESGHVRVYENQEGTWVQIGQDIDGEAVFDRSGWSVSLSADGAIVAIGAPQNSGNGGLSGHVRVYQNQGNSWIQIGQDIDGEASNDQSGSSVSLSSDGNIVAIGATGNDGNGNFSGHVRIYENQGGAWTQIGQDIDGGAIQDFFGFAVDLSSDGTKLVVGAPGNDDNGEDAGQVQIFENQEGNWVQIGQNINGETTGDIFGTSLDMTPDGMTVAIGAPSNDGNGNLSGHARVYEIQDETWVQIGQDIDGEEEFDQSAESVSISSNGTILAIGARFNDGNGNFSGHARIYQNISGSWTQIGVDIDGENAGDAFGRSVSLSSDGSIVAISSLDNDQNGVGSGHVRVFDLSDILSTEDFTIHNSVKIYPNPTSNNVSIELTQGIVLQRITIYNNLGQLVATTKSVHIDTFSLSKGIYFIKVETNKGSTSQKLIKI